MRKLSMGFVFLAGLWCAYWFGASLWATRALEDWRAEQISRGWQIDWDQLQVNGFPARFDSNATGLSLQSPDNQLSWSAPGLRIAQASWQPWDVTIDGAQNQTLRLGREAIAIDAEKISARAKVNPAPGWPLMELGLLAMDAQVTGLGWQFMLGDGRASTARVGGQNRAHTVLVSVDGLVLPTTLKSLIDPEARLPATIARLLFSGVVELDQVLNADTPNHPVPTLTALDIAELSLDWGDAGLDVSGSGIVQSTGVPEGRFNLRIRNWRLFFDISKDRGLVRPGLEQTILRTLEALAAATGEPSDIDTTLNFQGGFMSLGPVPLGAAPTLPRPYLQ